MKTSDLQEWRQKEIEEEDDTNKVIDAKLMLEQFNQVKRILLNLAVQDKGKKTLVTDLSLTVLHEMRKQRKIQMILQGSHVDEYIHLDMTEINVYDPNQWQGADANLKRAIEDKLAFRQKLAQDISTTKLNYMLTVLKQIFGKGLVIDPDAFKRKLHQMRRLEKGAV